MEDTLKMSALTAPTAAAAAAPVTPTTTTSASTIAVAAATTAAVGIPISPRAPGMLDDHALSTQLLPVQLVNGVVGIPIIFKLHESITVEEKQTKKRVTNLKWAAGQIV